MARAETRAELWAGCNTFSLCDEGHETDDLDLAMQDVEKGARVSLYAITGLIKDSEGCVIEEQDLEIVRQVIWTLERKVRHAVDVYWKSKEAPTLEPEAPQPRRRATPPTPPGATVVALPPRAGA